MKLNLQKNDIVHFIKIVYESFHSLAEQKQIKFDLITNEKKLEVCFDEAKLEKVLINIINNAIKFTGDNGKIRITLEKQENLFEIKVEDNGIGIDEDKLDKIFDRFYQVGSNQAHEFEGTGIGLALSKELIELHKGTIKVKSEINKFTCFSIILPIVIDKNDEMVADGNSEAESQNQTKLQSKTKENERNILYNDIVGLENGNSSRSKHPILIDNETEAELVILIVEDNVDMREYIRISIPDNYRILMAKNGQEGLQIATYEIPDLIISDILMPQMDGNELVKKLKTDERTNHIPIILITAKAGMESKIKGLETGVDAYLTKPFDNTELLVRIRKLIEQRTQLRERYKRDLTLQSKTISVKSIDDKFLKRVLDKVEANISNPEMNVDFLGEELYMSRTQLYRKVKALSGLSPNDFIRTVRLKRALLLLDNNFGNISEIAFEVGFNNPSYFAECFKKMFGKSPSEYLEGKL
jgi:DNA-binding response OmpR family regulator